MIESCRFHDLVKSRVNVFSDSGFCGSFELKAGDFAQDLIQSQILQAQSLRVLTWAAKICHVHSRTLHFSEHLDHQVFPDVSTDFMSCRWHIIKCFLIKKVHDLSKMEASFKILSFWAKGCATVKLTAILRYFL